MRFHHVSGHDEPNLSGRVRRTLSLGVASQLVFALVYYFFRRAALVLPSCFSSGLCCCDLSALPASSRMGRTKHLRSHRCPLIRSVRVLHGLPSGTPAIETALPSPMVFLSHSA